MRILVDADACPVVQQVESVARWHRVPVTLLCDTNHVLRSDYSEVKVIGAGADAVDFVLINLCHAGDVVVTQDRGVAAMALGKSAFAIHQDGWQYVDDNMDSIKTKSPSIQRLYWRHLQRAHKRTAEDDENFLVNFDRLLSEIAEHEEEESLRRWAASIADRDDVSEASRKLA